MLGRMVGELLSSGVAPITVVTGHRRSDVEQHLGEAFPEAELRFVSNERFAETNNIVSLLLALETIDRSADLVLVECDVVLGPGLVQRLTAGGSRNAMLIDDYATGMDGTVVRLDERGTVTSLIVPSQQDDRFDYRGTFKTLNVYRFTAAFWSGVLHPGLRDAVQAGHVGEYYEAVLARLGDLGQFEIAGELVAGTPWAELDDPHDLAAARFVFEPSARGEILDRAQGGHWAFEHQDHALLRNVHFPTAAMVAGLRHALPELLGSYGSAQSVLDQKLAWFVGCDPRDVIALSGASQAFPILRRQFAGARVAIPAPTFGEYPRMFPEATTYADRPGSQPALSDELMGAHDVVVVVTPNNPTGTTFPAAELLALASAHPSTTLLIDESFVPFSDGPSVLEVTGGSLPPNVLVLMSLSKSLGVPGARLGFLASGDRALLDAVRAEVPIWNMGAIAEHLLELLLKFRPALAQSYARTCADRDALAEQLRAAPMVAEVHAGGGNFVLARLHGPASGAAAVREHLIREHRINIKDVSSKFEDGAPRLRIGVRTAAENAVLVARLSASFEAVT